MLQTLRRHLPIVLTAVLTATVFAAGPTVAQAAFDAVNSDKVDGKHAVGAGATPTARAGKLVATNGSGRLPNNIIAKAPDAQSLDGKDSTEFLGSTDTAWDSEKLDGQDSSAFLAANGKAADADKLDGLDSSDLLVTGGGATGDFTNVTGCTEAPVASYELVFDRPTSIMATAWTSLYVMTDIRPSIQIQLLDSSGELVARSNRTPYTAASTVGNPTLDIAEVLLNTSGSAPYIAAPGTYSLRILGDNSGLCDNTRYAQYQSPRLTHVLLATGQ